MTKPIKSCILSDVHVSPGPSEASRNNKRSRRSMTAFINIHGEKCSLSVDADLERKTALYYSFHPLVKKVTPQPAAVYYRDLDGVTRKHTFDFLIEFVDGSKWFIFCKPLEEYTNKRWDIFLNLVAEQLDPSVANKIKTVTEYTFTAEEVDACELFLEASRHYFPDMETKLLSLLRRRVIPTSVQELDTVIGNFEQCWWSALRLLSEGRIDRVGDSFINTDTKLMLPTDVAEVQ